VNCSKVISVEQVIASMSYLDRLHEILQIFSGRLFDPRDNNGAIKLQSWTYLVDTLSFYSPFSAPNNTTLFLVQ